MLIEITTSNRSYSHTRPLFQTTELSVFFENREKYGRVTEGQDYFNYFTQDPVLNLSLSDGSASCNFFSERDLRSLQNEVTGVSIGKVDGSLSFVGFSARISRSRLYFLIREGSLYLSYDLRKLLPYSRRKLRREIAYGIIKFGEAPEYLTVIEDIYCIPGGRYLKGDIENITAYIEKGVIPESDLAPYFQVRYPMTGGNTGTTVRRLKEILQFISPKNPSLLVSGGVDSSLLNFLYDEITDKPYPAVFFHFDEAPEELAYAKRSIQNTKAEFIPITITGDSMHYDFAKSIERLIHPVYDNGSAFSGYQFQKQFLNAGGAGAEHVMIEGTLADSCYGVRNYNRKLKTGDFQPEWLSCLKEWIYSRMLAGGMKSNRTRPRDSFLNDEFLQDLQWYGGPFTNTLFNDAKSLTVSLKKRYYGYLDFLHPDNRSEYWPVYTILKLMLYAGKQTTVKTHDMLLPHQVYYPFMFRTILEDQGEYTWKEKSENDVIKAPLKRILEKYTDKSFIYRNKTGLQSKTKRWLLKGDVRPFICDLLQRKGGVADTMMGSKHRWLLKQFKKEEPVPDLVSVALSLSVLQYWCDLHNVETQS